ncbi:MAG: type IV pilus assembly protein PilM [Candidatus Eisenbacteria bacterium]|nr:type IV pilus assembly protein PilM [Candidatus Eisenbacteria bacterium]
MRQSEQHRGLVGLDIGSTSVKLVELSGQPGSFALENIAVVAVPEDASSSAYCQAISLVLEGKDLQTERVATSISGRKVAVRGMRFPRLADKEIAGAIRYEGSQVIAFDIDDSYADHCVMKPADSHLEFMDILFVAARKEAVDARTTLLEGAGLEPRVVGVDALVLLDALLERDDLPETFGVVNMGAVNTSIGITREDAVPFVRDIDIAGSSYTAAIASALSIDLEEAEKLKITGVERDPEAYRAAEGVTRRLVKELSRSLVYYQTRGNGSPVNTLFLCGGSSSLPGVREAMSELLSVEVRIWSPLDDIGIDDARFDAQAVTKLSPVASLAAALAMKQDPN